MTEIHDPESAAGYTERQQLYALSFAANAAGSRKATEDTLEKQLEIALKTGLFAKLPGWSLAWGPKVWKDDPSNPDTPPTNAWYVAKKQSKLVLAIAGTAPESLSGWMQNFDVIKTVPWDKWVSGWPKNGPIPDPVNDKGDDYISAIAQGTAEGVQNILSNKSTRAGSGTYVQDFLQQQPANTEIYVVGHSMGGALAPTVALGLIQSQIITGKTVQVEASAGASPGNIKFTKQWMSQFPSSNLYNTKDVVPQAWQVATGKDRCLPNIYNNIYANQDLYILTSITLTTSAGEAASKQSGITYFPLRGKAFTSDIQIPQLNSLDPDLYNAIREQHITAYLKELGLTKLIQDFSDVLDDNDDIGHVLPAPENVPAGHE